MTLSLSSKHFSDNGDIPAAHTCEGPDTSPELSWSGIPVGTKSLTLIVADPDAPDPAAPKMTWVHWVLYNLPPNASGLAAGMTRAQLPPGTEEGLNDWKQAGYRGPCPPIGRHRYFFKVYALDATLSGLTNPTKAEVEKAMHGHILAEAQRVGLYAKRGR